MIDLESKFVKPPILVIFAQYSSLEPLPQFQEILIEVKDFRILFWVSWMRIFQAWLEIFWRYRAREGN